jgi:hypothetical protein
MSQAPSPANGITSKGITANGRLTLGGGGGGLHTTPLHLMEQNPICPTKVKKRPPIMDIHVYCYVHYLCKNVRAARSHHPVTSNYVNVGGLNVDHLITGMKHVTKT